MSPLQCQDLTGKLMSKLLILSSTLYYNYDEFPKLMSKKKKKKERIIHQQNLAFMILVLLGTTI